jgi:transcriptional regulator GlxA family with amidase domain
MDYQTSQSEPPLDQAIVKLWRYEHYQPDHALERVLPAGTLDLIVLLDHDELPLYDPHHLGQVLRTERMRGPVVAGAHAGYFVIDTLRQARCMGVHFKPGGARALLGLPMHELADQQTPLEALWPGNTARALRERLCEACSVSERFAILEATLLEHWQARFMMPEAINSALAVLERTPHAAIAQIARRAGLSHRCLIEGFKAHIGLTPRLYGRIQRFQAALPRLRDDRPVDWCQLALSCGYYDQAHFNRDFKAFAGVTPTAYRALRSEHLNHVPLPEQGQICPIPAPPSAACWGRP